MTAHYKSITEAAAVDPPTWYPAKHPLPAQNLEDFAREVVVFTPALGRVNCAISRARLDLPGLAGADVVRRAITHNPDSVWGIARRQNFDANDPVPEGFVAFLMLNSRGVQCLLDGTFDAGDPDIALLSNQNQRPAGIYLWAMWARDGLVAGIPLAFEKMWTPLYRDADLFARAVTQDGKRLLETMGFTQGATVGALTNSALHHLRRSKSADTNNPLYDRYDGEGLKREIAVTVARSIEDLMRIVSIRSAVYIGEQQCPYTEEFDGNDFCSTHLIGYVGNEPAGCLRVRYFADFAKIERLAVRKEFRSTRTSFKLVRAAIDLCRMKGYQRLYGHAQKRLVNFWAHFGFETFEGGQELIFSDFDYVEMQLNLTRHPAAITIGVDPYVIIRPEGRWHKQGVLEISTSRPISHPSIQDVVA